VLAVTVAVLALASPAGAGGIGPVIEAATDGALAIAVSQAHFPAGSAAGAVVTSVHEPGTAAVAAAFAGGAAGRVPVLFTGAGVSDAAVRAEIARVTDGPGTATVWLAGAQLGGLEGYDVRDLGDSAADVSRAVLASGPASGTANRVLVFDGANWQAGVVAAGFGAAYGIPVVVAAALPDGLATGPKPVGLVIGPASVPAGAFSSVQKFERPDPTALSILVATELTAKEHPAGAPLTVPVPVEPVAADGYGTDPGPALLAPVVAAARQVEGARPPVMLVDGRPGADLAGGCASGAKDKAALCFMAQSDGATRVLALRADAAAARGRLPATGGSDAPLLAASVVVVLLLVRRRMVVR
jgi:hypothetical protein